MKKVKLIALACVMCAFASCGVLKNKSKSSEKLEVSEEVKINQSSTEKTGSSAESKEKEIDKGYIVTEKETTTTTTKDGGRIKVNVGRNDLKHGDNYIKDSAGIKVNAILDTLTGALTIDIDVKGESTVKVEKERIIDQRDMSKERNESKQDSTNKQVANAQEGVRRVNEESSSSSSKANVWAILMNNIGWGIAFLIILVGVIWWFFGFRKK